MTFNHPFVYSSLTPVNVAVCMPELAKAAKGEHITKAPFFHKAAIASVGGQQFTSFAKASEFGKGRLYIRIGQAEEYFTLASKICTLNG